MNNLNLTPLVSVIIPCYNVVKRGADIEMCVKSALSQGVDALEIVMINDGSKDETGARLEALAARHSCVRVIHQENRGVSGARNAGIEAAQGEWIFFLDADDFIEENGLRTLLDAAKPGDEIVCGAYTVIFTDEGNRQQLFAPAQGEKQAILESLIRTEGALNSMCARLYRRAFLMQNHLRAPLGVKVGEDVLFNLQAFLKAKSFTLLDKSVYRYELGGASAMGAAKADFYAAQQPLLAGIDTFLRENHLKQKCFRAQADSVLRQLRRGYGKLGAAVRFSREMKPYLKGVTFAALDAKAKIVYAVAKYVGILAVLLP